MNYDLAKKLKNAGFPLQRASMEDADDSKRKKQIFWYGKDSLERESAWLSPTLSELIEVCGVSFRSLTFFPETQDAHWVALGYDDSRGGSMYSPEEAVANLWLTLQSKGEGR